MVVFFAFSVESSAQIGISFCPETGISQIIEHKKPDEIFAQSKQQGCVSPELVYYDRLGGYTLMIAERRKNRLSQKTIGINVKVSSGNSESERLDFYQNLTKLYPRDYIDNEKIKLISVPKTSAEFKFSDLYESAYSEFQNHESLDFSLFDAYSLTDKGLVVEFNFTKTAGNDTVLAILAFDKLLKMINESSFGTELRQSGNSEHLEYKSISCEFPQIILDRHIGKNSSKISCLISAPKNRRPPEFTFTKDKLIIADNDTLIVRKSNDYDSHFVEFFCKDESRVKKLTLSGSPLEISADGHYNHVLTKDKNNSDLVFFAEDEHGYRTSMKIHVIFMEEEEPKVELKSEFAERYTNYIPVTEIFRTKTGDFRIDIAVLDDSPIDAVTVNGKPVHLKNSKFTIWLDTTYFGKTLEIGARDIHGNVGSKTIPNLVLKEKQRQLPKHIFDDFETAKAKESLANGLEISQAAGYFYIKRQDTTLLTLKKYYLYELPYELNFEHDFSVTTNYKKLSETYQAANLGLYFGYIDNLNYYYVIEDGDLLELYQVLNGEPILLESKELCYDFYNKEKGTEYSLAMYGFKQFYSGRAGDPKDILNIVVGNNNPNCEKITLSHFPKNIRGKKFGFLVPNTFHIGISDLTIHRAEQKKTYDIAIEKRCFSDCFASDTTLTQDFIDCIEPDYYAYIFSNENYKTPSVKIDSANFYAQELANILVQKYQFQKNNVILKNDLSKDSFEWYLNEKIPNSITGNKKVLIYFIGHGTENSELQLTDGKAINKEVMFAYLGKIMSKDVLVGIDACFSGTMQMKNETYNSPERLIRDSFDKKSRILITASNKQTTRQNLFTKHIIEELKSNTDRYFSVDRIFNNIVSEGSYQKVSQATPTSTVFREVDHQSGGSFFFINTETFNKK